MDMRTVTKHIAEHDRYVEQKKFEADERTAREFGRACRNPVEHVVHAVSSVLQSWLQVVNSVWQRMTSG